MVTMCAGLKSMTMYDNDNKITNLASYKRINN